MFLQKLHTEIILQQAWYLTDVSGEANNLTAIAFPAATKQEKQVSCSSGGGSNVQDSQRGNLMLTAAMGQ